MNEQEQEQLERYLDNALSDPERLAFEQALQENPTLRQEVERHRLALLAIRLKGREQLRKRWSVPPETKTVAPAFPAWLLPGFIVLLLLSVLTWWWWPSQISSGRSDTPVNDTLPVGPPSPPIPVQDGNGLPKEQQRSGDTKKLFAGYFAPYRDETLNPTVRDPSVPSTALDRFQQVYWNRQYAEALKAFHKLDPALKKHDNLLFLKANALLATDKTNEALVIFENIIRNGRSAYVDDARWYEALCHLKKGNREAAEKSLSYIVNTRTSVYREKAPRILAQIR